MIGRKSFSENLEKLEEVFNWKLTETMVSIWWDCFFNETPPFEDADIDKGSLKVITTSRTFPTLSEFLKQCHEARLKRIETLRVENAAHKSQSMISVNKIIEYGNQHKSTFVQELCKNVKDLTSGTIDKSVWLARQREIHARHKKK